MSRNARPYPFSDESEPVNDQQRRQQSQQQAFPRHVPPPVPTPLRQAHSNSSFNTAYNGLTNNQNPGSSTRSGTGPHNLTRNNQYLQDVNGDTTEHSDEPGFPPLDNPYGNGHPTDINRNYIEGMSSGLQPPTPAQPDRMPSHENVFNRYGDDQDRDFYHQDQLHDGDLPNSSSYNGLYHSDSNGNVHGVGIQSYPSHASLGRDANIYPATEDPESYLLDEYPGAQRTAYNGYVPPVAHPVGNMSPYEIPVSPGPYRHGDHNEQFVSSPQRPSYAAPSLPLFHHSSSYTDDDEDFRPFPIAPGEGYALNTFETDGEDDFSDRIKREDDTEDDRGTASYSEGDVDEELDMEKENLPDITEADMPPPGLQNRRRIKLYRGNLVLDCPVSHTFLSQFPDTAVSQRELTHMRYSAATCDPHNFAEFGFTLRPVCYESPRSTELFVAITIYNEDDVLLGRTLQGVFKNIKHLVSRTKSKTWGREAWKKVVVCVIADGRDKIHPRALALMGAIGVYQDGFAKNLVNDRPVNAHIYEYTTRCNIKVEGDKVKLVSDKTVPIQMIFCLKEKNQKKINSHRWFFQAFAPILRPNVCVLLDAGTQPSKDSIYHLWKSFDLHPNVGGACGEIKAGLGKGWSKLLNPLVAAQNFEYKMSNILDKPLESVFGFISVLPGAFSAYRYIALQNDINGQGPLEKYFKGEHLHDSNAGIFTANMYLAEDRILCYELVAKRDQNWVLKYVKSAEAETDVPDRLAELVLQRRRWLNGSFFAAVYALAHTFSIWRSGHSLLRKLALHLEFLYQLLTMLFSWFGIGNYFLVFRILTNSLGDPSLGFAPGKYLSVVFLWIYCACIVTIFVLSFGNRPLGTHRFYIAMVLFFAILMAYLMFAAIYISVKSVQYAICMNNGFSAALVVQNRTFRDLVISILSTYALYFVASFLFFEPWHMFTSFLQYLLISPSYINVLNVYAFCNIHDISWGTKGDTELKLDLGVAKANESGKIDLDVPGEDREVTKLYLGYLSTLDSTPVKEDRKPSQEDVNKDYYAWFRSMVVLAWIFTNVALVAVVLNTAGLSVFTNKDGSKGSGASSGSSSDTSNSAMMFKRQTNPNPIPDNSGQCGNLGTGADVNTQIYLSVILWAVAALAAFRFIGSLSYLLGRLIGH